MSLLQQKSRKYTNTLISFQNLGYSGDSSHSYNFSDDAFCLLFLDPLPVDPAHYYTITTILSPLQS